MSDLQPIYSEAPIESENFGRYEPLSPSLVVRSFAFPDERCSVEELLATYKDGVAKGLHLVPALAVSCMEEFVVRYYLCMARQAGLDWGMDLGAVQSGLQQAHIGRTAVIDSEFKTIERTLYGDQLMLGKSSGSPNVQQALGYLTGLPYRDKTIATCALCTSPHIPALFDEAFSGCSKGSSALRSACTYITAASLLQEDFAGSLRRSCNLLLGDGTNGLGLHFAIDGMSEARLVRAINVRLNAVARWYTDQMSAKLMSAGERALTELYPGDKGLEAARLVELLVSYRAGFYGDTFSPHETNGVWAALAAKKLSVAQDELFDLATQHPRNYERFFLTTNISEGDYCGMAQGDVKRHAAKVGRMRSLVAEAEKALEPDAHWTIRAERMRLRQDALSLWLETELGTCATDYKSLGGRRFKLPPWRCEEGKEVECRVRKVAYDPKNPDLGYAVATIYTVNSKDPLSRRQAPVEARVPLWHLVAGGYEVVSQENMADQCFELLHY